MRVGTNIDQFLQHSSFGTSQISGTDFDPITFSALAMLPKGHPLETDILNISLDTDNRRIHLYHVRLTI